MPVPTRIMSGIPFLFLVAYNVPISTQTVRTLLGLTQQLSRGSAYTNIVLTPYQGEGYIVLTSESSRPVAVKECRQGGM